MRQRATGKTLRVKTLLITISKTSRLKDVSRLDIVMSERILEVVCYTDLEYVGV